jgi:quinol monooxygenase YgiN
MLPRTNRNDEMKIGVVGHTRIQEDKCAQFEEVIAHHVQLIHANNPGVEFYKVFRSRENPCEYMFMEVYRDRQTLELHRQATYLEPTRKALSEIREGKPVVKIYDAI